MDRALWVVVGKVASLMLLAGVVSLSRAEPLAIAVVGLGLAAYAVSMGNLLRAGDDEAPAPSRAHHPPGRSHVTDGGSWSREA